LTTDSYLFAEADAQTFYGTGRKVSEPNTARLFSFLHAIEDKFLPYGSSIIYGEYFGIILTNGKTPYIKCVDGTVLRSFSAFVASTDELLTKKQTYNLVREIYVSLLNIYYPKDSHFGLVQRWG